MRRKYTYIPNEEIESLTTWEGKEVSGSKLLDGAYVRGKFAEGGDIDSEIERLEKALDNRYLPDSAKQQIVKKIFKLKGERVIHTQFEEEGFTYGHGGETGAISMTDQMHEAKEILGARKWNSLSNEEKRKTVEYLIAKGEIESDEYAKGGGVKMPTPVQLVLKGKKTDIKGFNFKVYEFDGVKYALMTPMNGKQYVEKYLGKADGGMMAKGGMTKEWTLKPDGRYYRKFVVDSKDYRLITEHGVTESMEELGNGKYEIVISVTEKGKDYFEKNMGNKYAWGGKMAKGGNVDEIVDAIYYSNNKKNGINTSFGRKTKEGLRAMIENDSYSSKEIAESIFSENQKNGRIDTTYGSKSILGLTEMINSARGNTFVKVKMAHGGMTKMSHGGRHRKLSVEERAEQMVGSSTWHSLSKKTQAGMIGDFIADGLIPAMAGGGGVDTDGQVMVVYTLVDGKQIKKKYLAAEVDEAIASFYLDNDVEDVEIIQAAPKAPAPEEAPKKKGLFALAKEEPKKGKGKADRRVVQVKGIAEQIRSYNEAKATEKKAKAQQEAIGGELKAIAKEKYLELYRETRKNPDSFNLADGSEEIIYGVRDEYYTVPTEKEEILKEYEKETGIDFLDIGVEYKFNSPTLDKIAENGERIGDIVESLIMDCKDISEEDKLKLFTVKRFVQIKKGAIDILEDFPNPEEAFDLIAPVPFLK